MGSCCPEGEFKFFTDLCSHCLNFFGDVGEMGNGLAVLALDGMDLGCGGWNWQFVFKPSLCGDVDLFNGEEFALLLVPIPILHW